METWRRLLAGTLGLCLGSVALACGDRGDEADAIRTALADPAPRWKGAMEALHVPSMVVVIVGPDGPLFVEELGQQNLEAGLPVTSETRFYIASATKPFVALATTLLAHRDSLTLNRPVRTYLPRFELADPTETITITVRDLLAHRRGLQDYAITFGEAVSGQMNDERFYRLLERVEAVGELDYQNLHYTLLGRVIEAVTGMSWKRYLERAVLRPAGLDRTTTRVAPLTADADAAVPYE
ncbi:MAG: serine hydrolase domain-containing protein, partial [Gemmatimonadota bacterium]